MTHIDNVHKAIVIIVILFEMWALATPLPKTPRKRAWAKWCSIGVALALSMAVIIFLK
jgi:multidrug transporter EmrE-like cation transporter